MRIALASLATADARLGLAHDAIAIAKRMLANEEAIADQLRAGPSRAMTYGWAAAVARVAGDRAQALAWAQQAVAAADQAKLPANDGARVQVLGELGAALLDLDRSADALAPLERADALLEVDPGH